jgi:hypothetical protein
MTKITKARKREAPIIDNPKRTKNGLRNATSLKHVRKLVPIRRSPEKSKHGQATIRAR